MEEKERGESRGVKVHIRLKQCTDKERETYHVFANATQLHVPNKEGRLELDRWYRFDHIYSAIASNREVYRQSSYDLVESALNGINTAIFAYGQTGSGKTHTLMSKDGVTAQMVSHLFNRIWRNTEVDYKVSCSYFQIYNENIYDLLNSQSNAGCFLREENGEVYVENVVTVLCETPMDVYELINIGRKSLVLAETKMYRLTCRSHAVCQLSIEKKWKVPGTRCRSMQETYVGDDMLLDEKEEGEPGDISPIDFTTVPFDKVELRRRHNVAVKRVNKNNRPLRSPSPNKQLSPRLPSSPRCQRDRSNSRNRSIERQRDGSNSRNLSSDGRHCRPRTSSEGRPNRARDSPASDLSSRTKSLSLTSSRTRNRYRSTNSTTSTNSDMSNSNSIESDNIYLDSEKSFTFSEGCLDDYFDFDDTPSIEDIEAIEGDEDMMVMKSKISIIDLAGSERLTDKNINTERLKEVQNINLSLLELGNVISALASGKKKHVPYRNSVLTRLLQDSLGGNCKTKFLLCISTKSVDSYETKCTLDFGQKLLRVCTRPTLNLDIDYKRKYDQLLELMKCKESNQESLNKKIRRFLYTDDKEMRDGKEASPNHMLPLDYRITGSDHIPVIKLDNSCLVYQEAHEKMDELKQRLADNEIMLKKKDEELSLMKCKFDFLLEEREKRMSYNGVKTLESATNTSLPDLLNKDHIDDDLVTPVIDSLDVATNTSLPDLLNKDHIDEDLVVTRVIDSLDAATNTSLPDLSKEDHIDDNPVVNPVIDSLDAATNTSLPDLSKEDHIDDNPVVNPVIDSKGNNDIFGMPTNWSFSEHKGNTNEPCNVMDYSNSKTNTTSPRKQLIGSVDNTPAHEINTDIFNGIPIHASTPGSGISARMEIDNDTSTDEFIIPHSIQDLSSSIDIYDDFFADTAKSNDWSDTDWLTEWSNDLSINKGLYRNENTHLMDGTVDISNENGDCSIQTSSTGTDILRTIEDDVVTPLINFINHTTPTVTTNLSNMTDASITESRDTSTDTSSTVPTKVASVIDDSTIECRDMSTNTEDDYLYRLKHVETCDVATNTVDVDNCGGKSLMETSIASTSTADISPTRTPIVVTFLQSPKSHIANVARTRTSSKYIAVETSDAATSTPSSNEDWLNTSSVDYNDIQNDCSISNPTKRENMDTITSAIKFWLSKLECLLDHYKQSCNVATEMVGEIESSNASFDHNTTTINDGVSTIILEVFEMLLNVLRANKHPVVPLSRPLVETPILYLQDYLRNRKAAIERELLDIVKGMSTHSEQFLSADLISEGDVLGIISQKLFDETSMIFCKDKLHRLLNLVMCDHTVTACLIALSKNSTGLEVMLRTIPPEDRKSSYQLATNVSPGRERNDGDPIEHRNSDAYSKRRKTFLSRILCMPMKSVNSKKSKETKKKAYTNV